MPEIIHNSITWSYPLYLCNMYLYVTVTHNIFTCATLGIAFVATSWKTDQLAPPSFWCPLETLKEGKITPWWPRVSDSSVSDLQSCSEVWLRTLLTFEIIISNYCDQNLFTQQTTWERLSRRKVFRIKNKQVFGECGSFFFWKKTINIISTTIPTHPVIVTTTVILHCFKVREGVS